MSSSCPHFRALSSVAGARDAQSGVYGPAFVSAGLVKTRAFFLIVRFAGYLQYTN